MNLKKIAAIFNLYPVMIPVMLLQGGCAVSRVDHLMNEKGLSKEQSVLKTTNLAQVWSGHPVGFRILTTNNDQYVAFYDSLRNMCIAQRKINSEKWKIVRLPSVTGWDSHNYITMARDRDGYIHVSGNMHVAPLLYFRSEKPDDISSFEQLPMVGQKESRVTYPVFFKDAEGNLFFQYRDGGSGNGVTLWNRYDAESRRWSRVFDRGFFDGEGEVNAYSSNPMRGPDGYFYIGFMWRATPIANTNHNLSCIRSRDLIHWESLKGKPVSLPVKWSNSDVYVDPTGPWNGLINSNFSLNWDNHKRLCIAYHKYDQDGNSQIFVARWESSEWKIYQLSKWDHYRWDINEGGSLGRKVGNVSLMPIGKNKLVGEYYNKKYGSGLWVINEGDFRILKEMPGKNMNSLPATLASQKPEIQGMQINRTRDNTGNYILQWETLPVNRDRPRNPPYPAPTWLKLIKLSGD